MVFQLYLNASTFESLDYAIGLYTYMYSVSGTAAVCTCITKPCHTNNYVPHCLCSAENEDVAVEGGRPLMPPTIEELEAIENEGSKRGKKDDREPHDKL